MSKCKNVKSLVENKSVAKCPKCGKNVLEKRSKKGKIFYSCEDYENCKFISWDIPLEESCPKCDCYLLKKETAKNIIKRCSNESCDYAQISKKELNSNNVVNDSEADNDFSKIDDSLSNGSKLNEE